MVDTRSGAAWIDSWQVAWDVYSHIMIAILDNYDIAISTELLIVMCVYVVGHLSMSLHPA